MVWIAVGVALIWLATLTVAIMGIHSSLWKALKELEGAYIAKDDPTFTQMVSLFKEAASEGAGHFVIVKADKGDYFYRLDKNSVYPKGPRES